MKKHSVFIAVLIAFGLRADAQAFIIANPSGNNDATEISCDYYQITPNQTFEQGAIWYTKQLNLSTGFDYTFDLFLGSNNGLGADGLAFVIQNQGQALGPQGSFGSQLGYGTFPGKSLAVEFDTHNNGPGAPYGDIAQQHIAIDTGGIQFPPAAGPVPAFASGANMDDGNWHTAEIVFVPGTETMTIFFDGTLRLTCTFTGGLAASLFNNQNLLYWGWTGAGGSKFNTEQVRIPLQADFVAANNYAQCGLNNVQFTDSSVSGLKNITWQWSLGDGSTATTQDVSHNYATSGSYNVELSITDGGGCTSDTTIPVKVYTVPVITPSQTNVTCFGNANGTAHAAVTGGTPNYTYTWLPFPVSTTNNASSLDTGLYGLIVTDIHGCADTTAYHITEPPALTDSLVQVNVLCHGQSTGSLTAIAGGGTPGYAYRWVPNINNTTNTLSNLVAGTYSSTVVDANGCRDSVQAVITQPAAPLTAALTASNVPCYGSSSGSVTVIATGGTPAYTYSWNPAEPANSSITQVPAGNYSVTISDANGCSLIEDTTITQPSAALTLSVTATPVLCYGYPTGTIIATPGGGTPAYSFALATGGASVTSDSGEFHNLLPTTYTITLTDQKGCTADSIVTVNQPPQLVIDSIPTVSPKCYGYQDGQIKVAAGGGTPGYTYQFSNGITDTGGIDNNLAAGTYKVTVTDNSGCTVADTTITLTQPDSVIVNVTPTPVQVILGNELQLGTTNNQSGTVTYSWSPDFGLSCYDCPDPVFNGVFSQPYNVVATNQNGCSGSFAFTVTVVPEYNIFFPNAFLPEGSGANRVWQVFGKTNAVLEFSVSVFDRLGEKVFESNSVDYQWDGTFKGKPAPMGVYTYMARIVWLNDYTEKLFEGTITLLR
jgi:gliding motility-associated-like protein